MGVFRPKDGVIQKPEVHHDAKPAGGGSAITKEQREEDPEDDRTGGVSDDVDKNRLVQIG